MSRLLFVGEIGFEEFFPLEFLFSHCFLSQSDPVSKSSHIFNRKFRLISVKKVFSDTRVVSNMPVKTEVLLNPLVDIISEIS